MRGNVLKKVIGLLAVAIFVFVATDCLAQNKSPMFSRKQPGGMFAVVDNTQTTGSIWFVDSGSAGAGSAAGYGSNPDAPYSTLELAIDAATANNGDWIMVMAGHTETITNATELNFDKAGIRIIGLGEGATRPLFIVDNTAAQIDVDAADITIENIVFDITATDAVVNFFDVNAANFHMKNCDVTFSDAAGQATNVFTLDANADGMFLENSRFLGSTDAGPNEVVTFANTAPTDVRIVSCYMAGEFVNAAVYGTGTPEVYIEHSQFKNYEAGDHCIEFQGNTTGHIWHVGCYTNAIATAMDPGTMELVDVLWYDTDHPADAVGASIFAESVSGFGVAGILEDTITISGGALPADPTANSLAAFIASGGTALGTELADSKSIVDAIGTNGTTVADTATGLAGIIGVDDADNAMATTAVVPNRDGSVFERMEFLQKFNGMAYVGAVTSSADTTHFVSTDLASFGTNYFVTDWSVIVLWDAAGANAAPEGEVRDVTGYVSATGTFTINPASTQLAANDVVLLIRDELVSTYQTALPAAPVANSLAAFIASGGTALGTELGDSMSIVDAIGTNGVAVADTVTGIAGMIGVNDADNAMNTAAVVANEDGSVYERLEQIQEAVNNGTGTPLPVNMSLVNAIGTDGTTPIDTATSVLGAIGVNDADNAMDTATVAANADGSVFERLEQLQARQTPRFATWTIADTTGWDTAPVFTVTGDVLIKVVGVVGATPITCTSATSTLSLGTTTAPAAIIAASTVNGVQFAASDVWIDATPADDIEIMASAAWHVIGGGADVVMTRNVDDLLTGVLTLYAWWMPLSANGNVIATP